MIIRSRLALTCFSLLCALTLACSPAQGAGVGSLTIYSGRVESLVGPLLDRFARESGLNVRIRYGDTAELAAAILEEGNNSPADVFFAQDAGALGAVAGRRLLTKLPEATLNQVDPRFRSTAGEWVGVNGRARVAAYNTAILQDQDLPDSVLGFADSRWRGRVGWAPTNGSFQAFVTALRLSAGEAVAKKWLSDMKANNVRAYANNVAIVKAVASREIDVGLVNHYYKFAIEKDEGPIPVQNYHPRDAGVDAMVNVAGAGILATSKNQEAARRFIDYLLSTSAQEYFVKETHEYALVAGVAAPAGAPQLNQIRAPNIDLNSLADLDTTLRIMREAGAL